MVQPPQWTLFKICFTAKRNDSNDIQTESTECVSVPDCLVFRLVFRLVVCPLDSCLDVIAVTVQRFPPRLTRLMSIFHFLLLAPLTVGVVATADLTGGGSSRASCSNPASVVFIIICCRRLSILNLLLLLVVFSHDSVETMALGWSGRDEENVNNRVLQRFKITFVHF